MKKARSFLAVAAVGFALLSVFGPRVAAQGTNDGQGNGLKIAPVRTDLTIEKGGSRQVSLFLENITAFPLTVSGVKNDFVASDDESGEPRIILDEKESAPGNSFKTLVGPLPSFNLKPAERREVRVTLSVPTDAPAGGYYGAIRFAPGDGQGDKNVSLNASVGTIFLIRVPGKISERLQVESFHIANEEGVTGSLFNSGPVSVVTRFKNLGNIHLQPFGKITVKSFSGKVIDEMEINNTQPRGSVLPGSIRKFDYPVKEKNLFGRYTVEGSFGYGSDGELILAKKTFYVIPFKMIAAVLLIVAFLIFVLPRMIRAYNRRIIQQAGGRNTSGPPAKPKARANPRSKPPRRR
jgi:hypothetical protein